MSELLGQALLIANANYTDKTLSALPGTQVDIRALEAVLADPAIGGYQVQTSVDETIHILRQRIERFFAQASKDSLLLLYISGHGVKDRDGKLYFAAADTESNLLMSTGLAATFIQEASERSRCRRQVFIFDSCFSGAFARGYSHKSDQKVYAQETFRGGTGKIVITASDDMQYSLVGEQVEGDAAASVFTRHMVEGLQTGTAAYDADVITADRLYQYVHEKVLEENPSQNPQLWSFGLSGDLILAHNPSPKSIKLPDEIVALLENSNLKVRLLGINELEKLLVTPALLPLIGSVLEKLRDDDSKMISTRAAEVQAELEKLRNEAESKRQAEEKRKRRVETEAKRKVEKERKLQAEVEAKRQAEEEHQRQVEETRRRQAEAEAKLKAEEEHQRQAEETRKCQAEAEAKRQAEEERKRQTEEKRKRQAEAEAKRQAEEKRKRQVEAETKRKVERELKRQVERELKRQAEREVKLQAEEERQRQVDPPKPLSLMEGIIVMVVTIVALAVFADLIKEGDARLTALLRRIPTFLEQKAADKATDGLVQENRVIEQQPKMTKWESGAKFAPVPPFPFRIEQQPNMTQEEKTR